MLNMKKVSLGLLTKQDAIWSESLDERLVQHFMSDCSDLFGISKH